MSPRLAALLACLAVAPSAWPARADSVVLKRALATAGAVGDERMTNGGFETEADGLAEGWAKWSLGYTLEAGAARTGERGARVTSAGVNDQHGATYTARLDQPRPFPIVVTGWSRARNVSGTQDNGYSIYLDVTYTDGTPCWGVISSFSTGTHDWEQRRVFFVPEKPIREVAAHALFRNHTGSADFDDFSLREMSGVEGGAFDSVPLLPDAAPPSHIREDRSVPLPGLAGLCAWDQATGALADAEGILRGGLFVRDVAAGGDFVQLRGETTREGDVRSMETVDEALGLRVALRVEPFGTGSTVRGEITDTTGRDRALSIYYSLPVDAVGWTWSDDARTDRPIEGGQVYFNGVLYGVGSTGRASRYPLAAITGPETGVALAVPLDCPRVCRLAYDGASRELYAAFDMALVPDTLAMPSRADFRLVAYRYDPAWRFRAALKGYYDLFPDHFRRVAQHEGLWMPFTDISTVQGAEDFGFAYHEGDNNVAWDDAHDVLSFVYTEPMTNWMSMPKEAPRTYEGAVALMEERATGGDGLAQATRTSGAFAADGRYDVAVLQAPWCDGAVFTLNADPKLRPSVGQPGAAGVKFDAVQRAFETTATGVRGWQGHGDVTFADGAVECRAPAIGGESMVVQAVTLDQTQPAPLVARASSRAEGVTGNQDVDYSLYVDLTYTDGDHLFSQTALFDVGTHDWQTREVRIEPTKPVQSANVHLLLRRGHTGTAWFDDVFLGEAGSETNLLANGGFDEGAPTAAVLDGTYIDSFEGWGTRPNYRREHFATVTVPLTFDTSSLQPVILTYFSTYEFAVELRKRMSADGKLVMANATPWTFPWAAHLLDVMGTETNWAPEGQYQPESDAIFNYRRAVCYQKPYLLLQNTVYDTFTPAMIERYFKRSIFYGCFPSFFSHNAADAPYWQNPALYNRDRPLFRKYIPLCKRISAAGWEPLTYARTSDPSIWIERYGYADQGSLHFTAFNSGTEAKQSTVALDLRALGLARAPTTVRELVRGEDLPVTPAGEVRLSLEPEDLAILSVGG